MVYNYGAMEKKKSNINKIESFQNIALRKLSNVPSYVSKHTIYFDLK
jgi:hypothetical protein